MGVVIRRWVWPLLVVVAMVPVLAAALLDLMKSTKVQTVGRIWRKYWNIWIENTSTCMCIRYL